MMIVETISYADDDRDAALWLCVVVDDRDAALWLCVVVDDHEAVHAPRILNA